MTNTTTISNPKTCVENLYTAFGANDVDAIGNCLAEDIVWTLCAGINTTPTKTYNGRTNVLNTYLPTLAENYQDLKVVPNLILVEGNTVCTVGTYQCVGNNGNNFDARYCHIFTVEGGEIVRFEQIVDTATINLGIGKVLN